jgi:hypothetical protein
MFSIILETFKEILLVCRVYVNRYPGFNSRVKSALYSINLILKLQVDNDNLLISMKKINAITWMLIIVLL